MGLFGKSEITHKGVLENNFISPKMAQNDIAQNDRLNKNIHKSQIKCFL